MRFIACRNVTNGSAVLRMKFTDHVYAQQFGPYRKRCAYIVCQTAKAGTPGRAPKGSPTGICQRPGPPMHGGRRRVL